jgi:ABC-type multidrug transport system ATPase subunit
MVGGFVEKLSGNIKVFGMNADDQRDNLDKILGVCP